MALTQPTLAELTAIFFANFESNLGQEAPIADKAYLRVDSAVEAAIAVLLLKFGTQESKENLASTASETGEVASTDGDCRAAREIGQNATQAAESRPAQT